MGSLRIWLIYTFIFTALATVVIGMMSMDRSNEYKVQGVWREVAWEYEKMDTDVKKSDGAWSIDERQKLEISEGLSIHEAETWNFSKDGTLELYRNNQLLSELTWKIKGRGHILKLIGKDDKAEHYQIQKLGDNLMEIHFNTDLQVRGIVKMTFVRS